MHMNACERECAVCTLFARDLFTSCMRACVLTCVRSACGAKFKGIWQGLVKAESRLGPQSVSQDAPKTPAPVKDADGEQAGEGGQD